MNTTLCFTVLCAIALYLALWLIARLFLGKGVYYHMDPQEVPGAFEPHLKRYQDIAKLLLTLSTASVAFLFGFLVNSTVGLEKKNVYALALEAASPRVIAFLCLSAFCALVFLLGQTYIYESYCHSKSKDGYTSSLYASQVAFGWSSLLWFVFAFGLLAYRVIR